jgi:hypothetical protein
MDHQSASIGFLVQSSLFEPSQFDKAFQTFHFDRIIFS